MILLTVNAHGQVALSKDALQHLGVRPGDKIELELLANGQGLLKGARPNGTIGGFVGFLAGRSAKMATIEDINGAASEGWAGRE